MAENISNLLNTKKYIKLKYIAGEYRIITYNHY